MSARKLLPNLVSTHAPLAGSDFVAMSRPLTTSPFQPTLPLRGATWCGASYGYAGQVSTHAPLTGSDVLEVPGQQGLGVSTHAPLAGSDRQGTAGVESPTTVSTHAPLAGSDVY